MTSEDAQMRAYYEQGKERGRLAGAKGLLEFARSKEIIQRRLPAAPAVVADIGGGPGRYSMWLSELGYTVEHRDLIELHVAQIQERLYEHKPEFLSLLDAIERGGRLPPIVPNGFLGYTHRPAKLADEIAEAGLQLEDLVGVEGLPLAAADMQARVADPTAWNVLLDAARAIERVPELLGVSPHMIGTATR